MKARLRSMQVLQILAIPAGIATVGLDLEPDPSLSFFIEASGSQHQMTFQNVAPSPLVA